MTFKQEAACQTLPMELMFPGTTKQFTDKQYWEVHNLCKECPVNLDCLIYSLENDLEYGIYALPERVRRRIKAKDVNDLKNILKETYKTLDIIEPEFNKDGSLKNKRCLKCNRKTRGFAKDNTNWGARLHYCVACHIEMKNNKQSDKLLDREKPSKSRPEFNNYGHLISKICTKCEVRKIANEFSKRPQGIGEKTSWCKACTRKNLENWQKKQKNK